MSIGENIIIVSSWELAEKSKFTGIAYTNHEIVIGQGGYDQFQNDCKEKPDFFGGRYSLFELNDGVWKLEADPFGQEAVYYYHGKNGWAACNSFLYLAEFLVSKGCSLTLDLQSLDTFFIDHSSAKQLVSFDTSISEIKLLPAGYVLSVENGGEWRKSFGISKRFSLEVQSEDAHKYTKYLVDYLSRAASVSRALIDEFRDQVRFDISGGLDSRVVFAIAYLSGVQLSEVNFCSNPRWEKDFVAAKNLAREIGFSISNRKMAIQRASKAEAIDSWRYGCLGVYKPVYPALGSGRQDIIQFHGGCGECFRMFFRGSVVEMTDNIKQRFPRSGESFQRKVLEAFRVVDLDPNDQYSSVNFYRHFRSRLHFGRESYKSLNSMIFTPFSDPLLLAASDCLNHAGFSSKRVFLDILNVSDSRFAQLAFDDPSKTFPVDQVEMSVGRTRGLKEKVRIRDYQVYRQRRQKDFDSYAGVSASSFNESLRSLSIESSKEILKYKSSLNGLSLSLSSVETPEELSSMLGDFMAITLAEVLRLTGD